MEADFVVRNVYSKIKNLENKYIDLANFYKEAAQMKGANLGGKPSDPTVENHMIRDLIDQKRDLEENIQGFKHVITSGGAPSKKNLHLAFQDIFDAIDSAQV